jgi:hypothetical protein
MDIKQSTWSTSNPDIDSRNKSKDYMIVRVNVYIKRCRSLNIIVAWEEKAK